MAASKRGSASSSGCPTCGQPVVRGASGSPAAAPPVTGKRAADPFPFCSTRCQLVDLGRWLDEEYRIPDHGAVVWTAPDGGDGGDGDDRG